MPPLMRAAGFAVCLLLGAGATAPAQAATVTGKLVGAKLPAKRAGVASVRAVDAKTLAIDAAARVRSGRYKLTVPAGRYFLLAATTSFRGKRAIDRIVGTVKLRRGARKAVRLSFKRKKRGFKLPTLPTSRLGARAAFVNVKYPAVWVKHFDVSGPSEFSVMRKGMADMLITDIVNARSPCGAVVVEREHLNAILAEQMLSQGPGFDPTTRAPLGKIIAHNREVTGSLSVAGGTATLTVLVTNVVTGSQRSVTRSAAADRIFELEASVVPEVVRLICGDDPPSAYAGQVSGSWGIPDVQMLTWSGNVRMEFSEVTGAIGDQPPGEYAHYDEKAGSLKYVLDGVDGDCTYHGEGIVELDGAQLGTELSVQQGVEEPTYSLGANLPGDASITYTVSGPDGCPYSGTWPLGGRVYIVTDMPQRSGSSQVAGTSTTAIGGIPLTTSWSLAPQP